MKYYLAVVAVFISSVAFCQEDFSQKPPQAGVDFVSVTSANTYAYIDGKRIDSLDAFYASFDTKIGGEVNFDYGQKYVKRKELVLTNEKGIPLVFGSARISFLLNFFHYNKWNLAMAPCSPGQTDWILKKE